MTEPKCEPTRWHEMTKPVEGGRKHYQEKSWKPFFEPDAKSQQEEQEPPRER